jgi:hypothetical protein
MSNLSYFLSPCYKNSVNIKSNVGILTILFLILLLLTPFIISCSRRLSIPEQNKSMPSAYTGTGKYVNYHTIGQRKDGIRKYTLKCPVSSDKK